MLTTFNNWAAFIVIIVGALTVFLNVGILVLVFKTWRENGRERAELKSTIENINPDDFLATTDFETWRKALYADLIAMKDDIGKLEDRIKAWASPPPETQAELPSQKLDRVEHGKKVMAGLERDEKGRLKPKR